MQKQTTKSRIADLEYKFEELVNNEKNGQSVGLEVISLYAIKTNLAIAVEEGRIKEIDMERCRNLGIKIRIKIDEIRRRGKS
jgi:hypothetical protein